MPKKFNVSTYKVWMINSDTNSTTEIYLKKVEGNDLIYYNFSVENGVIYFKVAALHPLCHEYGCVNSTSPFISISKF